MKDFENIDAVKTGKFIKELRKSHHMKQDELGEKLFISRKSVSKWETGRSCPSVDMLKRLSKVFGVTVYDLMAGEFINGPEKIDSEHKFISIKNFKNIGVFSLVLIFIVLVCFYFLNKNSVLTFRVNYEDDYFTIRNGLLVLDDRNYLTLGRFESHLPNGDSKKLNSMLYIKDGDNIEELMTIKLDSTNSLPEEVKSKIVNLIKDGVIDNLYLKIYYFNENDEEISFNLKLKITNDKKSVASDNRTAINFKERSFISSHSKDIPEEIEETGDFIDLNFLFDMDKRSLDKCIRNMNFAVSNIDYDAYYDFESDSVVFYNNFIIIQIDVNANRVFIKDGVDEYHYIISDTNILYAYEVKSYYDLLYHLIEAVTFSCYCS